MVSSVCVLEMLGIFCCHWEDVCTAMWRILRDDGGGEFIDDPPKGRGVATVFPDVVLRVGNQENSF